MVKSQTPINSRLTGWLAALVLACTTVLSACSSSNDDSGSAPTMPGNLSATVHSPHKIELIWTPSTDDGLVMGYDIIRDGVQIKELLKASNFSDSMLEPATTYQYSVIAVDDDGNRSISSNVEATTLDGPLLSAVITVDNHVALLRHVFDIYSGNAYFADLATLPDWSDPAYAGLPDHLSVETAIVCLNGGTALFTPLYAVSFGATLRWDFEFDNCQDDSSVIDGQLVRRFVGGHSGEYRSISSDSLSIDDQSLQVQFSGAVSEGGGGFSISRSASDVFYSTSDESTSFELSNVNTVISPGASDSSMRGGFTVRSEITGNRPLHAEVIEEFYCHYQPSNQACRLDDSQYYIWTYQIGELELTADDGSKLMLNADNGDHTSVTIEITAPAGDSETLIQPWSLWEDSLRFDANVFYYAWSSN